jgi:hypothetical protein
MLQSYRSLWLVGSELVRGYIRSAELGPPLSLLLSITNSSFWSSEKLPINSNWPRWADIYFLIPQKDWGGEEELWITTIDNVLISTAAAFLTLDLKKIKILSGVS